MKNSTTSLSFPDINVCLALSVEEHIHRVPAMSWWQSTDSGIALTRFTQVGVLRLLTTAAVMKGKPLSMAEAWRTYDRFVDDPRVVFLAEPDEIEAHFRKYTVGRLSSPKLWADAWLLAFARTLGGTVVTFDRTLAARAGADGLLLA